MKLGITVLGSGSSGNALLLHTEKSAILVDAGFSRKEMLARLATVGIDPAIIKGLLITHEHGDHVKGARVLADHLDIPTFLTPQTYKHLHYKNLIGKKVNVFDTGSPFDVDIFNIHPFVVPHDAMDPVGFAFFADNFKIGVVTDLGHINNLVKARLMECDALILECNHDIQMLKKSDRSLSLKRRILGRFGHLNNEDAINALNELLHPKTQHLVLYHLSGECNCREKVAELAIAKLAELNRQDVNYQIAQQHEPMETMWL
jgi:phosphoribosyl 1,2-cyclic phosphodiesterase